MILNGHRESKPPFQRQPHPAGMRSSLPGDADAQLLTP